MPEESPGAAASSTVASVGDARVSLEQLGLQRLGPAPLRRLCLLGGTRRGVVAVAAQRVGELDGVLAATPAGGERAADGALHGGLEGVLRHGLEDGHGVRAPMVPRVEHQVEAPIRPASEAGGGAGRRGRAGRPLQVLLRPRPDPQDRPDEADLGPGHLLPQDAMLDLRQREDVARDEVGAVVEEADDVLQHPRPPGDELRVDREAVEDVHPEAPEVLLAHAGQAHALEGAAPHRELPHRSLRRPLCGQGAAQELCGERQRGARLPLEPG
eukprot:CAMPEP_0204574288 /NCGR_PEP_ID=MMETSP0661-20131031/40516_1 /ASSEMBLY_ACC=CAM_ASM_000606 /TAXON_ID=109239 /ORGANISM="Alexandrium margalefi, Strain AMGDE01CS-322" /LENGTH=269 /DNA_ID=CAMNT_0051582799 /DNA_START=75 /DNA_END=881 /DNA_ORIENTATION=+